MKRIGIIVILIFMYSIGFAQKPMLPDSAYFMDWPELGQNAISPDGRYVMYTLTNVPKVRTVSVIKAIGSPWKREFPSLLWHVQFSSDSKKMYCIDEGKLLELSLGTNQQQYLGKANGFEYIVLNNRDYIIYKPDGSSPLLIRNLASGTTQSIEDVKEFKILTATGSVFLKLKDINENTEVLKLLDIPSGVTREIYRGNLISKVIFDKSNRNIAFLTEGATKIWHYTNSMKQADLILKTDSIRNGKKVSVDDAWEFSEDGSKLYLTLPSSAPGYVKKENGEVEIWSYQDEIFFPEYKKSGFKTNRQWRDLASFEIKTGKLTQLLFGNEHRPAGHVKGRNKIVVESGDSLRSYYIVDENTSQRVPIKISTKEEVSDIQFSPDNKFIIYNDGSFKSFEIATQRTIDFTEPVRPELEVYDQRMRSGIRNFMGIFAWIEGTTHLIIPGKFGLWELDVTGKEPPRNLTQTHEDAASKTVYYVCNKDQDFSIAPGMDLYAYGINFDNKDVSLYRIDLKRKACTKLYNGSFFWTKAYSPVNKDLFNKATGTDAFLVQFPTVENSPNLLFTKDFKQFDTLTHLMPEKKYNWITSELHTYKDSLGNLCQGILYKPENFDENKKYPVILFFYQERSQLLNQHIAPDPVGYGFNIPHLVSRGYLVFAPDIYIAPGKFGEYLMLSINAAADHLSKCKWINRYKMAIAGHSYGGYEVNYILTHSKRFAAALSGSGLSSIANNVFDLARNHGEIRSFVAGNSRMGVNFEDNPELYINNSPIFKTKYIETPVLMLHNEDDLEVPFYHGAQFFMSLRQQKKKAWLVSYKNGGHGVPSKYRISHMIMVDDFLDHFLKDAPMPDWMIRHVTY